MTRFGAILETLNRMQGPKMDTADRMCYAAALRCLSTDEQAAQVNGQLRYRYGVGFRPSPADVGKIAEEVSGVEELTGHERTARRVYVAPPEMRGIAPSADPAEELSILLASAPPKEWVRLADFLWALRRRIPWLDECGAKEAAKALHHAKRMEIDPQSRGAELRARLVTNVGPEQGKKLIREIGAAMKHANRVLRDCPPGSDADMPVLEGILRRIESAKGSPVPRVHSANPNRTGRGLVEWLASQRAQEGDSGMDVDGDEPGSSGPDGRVGG